jgi:2-keto-3-deoxy-L-rhamnonate aldolase RhmA
VQSNPWLGEDPRTATDVARALALGARYVLVSNRGRRDIEACVRAIYDWHRKIMVVHPFVGMSAAEAEQEMRKVADQTFVIPQPEAKSALDEALETLAIPEVRMLFVATGDASRELSVTGAADWYAPKLWELIESLVAAAKEKGAVIGASTSSGADFSELARRVERLHKFGVQMIMIQGAPYLFQLAVGKFVRELRALLQ